MKIHLSLVDKISYKDGLACQLAKKTGSDYVLILDENSSKILNSITTASVHSDRSNDLRLSSMIYMGLVLSNNKRVGTVVSEYRTKIASLKGCIENYIKRYVDDDPLEVEWVLSESTKDGFTRQVANNNL